MAVFRVVRAVWRRVRRLMRRAWRACRPVVVGLEMRVEVLNFAAGFTSDPTSSLLIAENARPVLAWLREAETRGDLKARLYALRQYQKQPADDEGEEGEGEVDNPQQFLKRVAVLYRFLAETADAEAQELLETDEAKLHAWMDGDKCA